MVKHALLALSLFMAGSLQASAQQNGPPYLDSKESYQIFVLGDSLAAGLWSGMTRAAAGDDRLAIDGRYKEDSGLARPDYYDWNDALPKILERNSMVGARNPWAQDARNLTACTGCQFKLALNTVCWNLALTPERPGSLS